MEAEIKWLDDPETFRVNQLPAHSDHHFYRNYAEWQRHKSSFEQSLDGQWQFKFAQRLRKGLRIFTRSILTLVTLIKLKFQVKLS